MPGNEGGNPQWQSCETSVLPKDTMDHTPHNVSVLTWTEVWADKMYHSHDQPQYQNQINKWPAFAYGNSHILGWISVSELKSWIINSIFKSSAVSCLNCSNRFLLWLHIRTYTPTNFNLPKLCSFPAGKSQWFPEVLPNTPQLCIKAYNTALQLYLLFLSSLTITHHSNQTRNILPRKTHFAISLLSSSFLRDHPTASQFTVKVCRSISWPHYPILNCNFPSWLSRIQLPNVS